MKRDYQRQYKKTQVMLPVDNSSMKGDKRLKPSENIKYQAKFVVCFDMNPYTIFWRRN